MNVLILALTLIVTGVLITAGGLIAPGSFDFAVSIMPGWHVTIFPPPLFAGLLVIMSGIAALLASVLWR
jgi:hypothetical protein